ncbi:putative Ras-related protein Rab-28 [Paratrimastix pyriformis]|uniref:Ras-related protein Rab-28 n=1 Tax=Paratrimastix pyriformis TaxID=342808 RepID=A0ABQ8UQ85_9EUKA|nr:putative Ras-related protein Rab-28 [Paratrimastix pyriformis]
MSTEPPPPPAASPEDSEPEDEIEHLNFKVVLLGDGAVGKTSIVSRFTEDDFAKNYKQTIGVDFFIKRLQLTPTTECALSIWDIGGQTIGSKMITKYIYGANAVLFCYDITSYQTFQNLEDWLMLVRRTFQGEPMPFMVLVGNKTDLSHLRTVKLDKHNKFAADNGIHPFFMSAKTGDNVHATMFRIAAHLSGVTLSKPELEMAGHGVRAEIVNHPQHELEATATATATGQAPLPPAEKKKGGCCIHSTPTHTPPPLPLLLRTRSLTSLEGTGGTFWKGLPGPLGGPIPLPPFPSIPQIPFHPIR